MILPRSQDAIHKTHLYRLLIATIDDRLLSQSLYFKGGTCAALAGWLDRFSLDLDFDLAPKAGAVAVKKSLQNVCTRLGFNVKQKHGLFFVVLYPAPTSERNSIKVSVVTDAVAANQYVPLYLSDINRYALSQSRDTMVANKLVAPLDRFERYGTIAGRDIYDIHHFLAHGFLYREEVIRERRGVTAAQYLGDLIEFITRHVTDRVIAEDLNYLLPQARFQSIRKTLKRETLVLLRDARERVKA